MGYAALTAENTKNTKSAHFFVIYALSVVYIHPLLSFILPFRQ